LERYRPQLRYCLVDEVRIADSELESLRNLAAALFRLEKSPGPEDVQRILVSLIEWLREPGLEELRRSFTGWLQRVFLPDRVQIEIPEVADLQEVKSMLAERVKEWSYQWKQEGLQEGRQEGRQEARREDLEKARGALVQNLEKRFGPLPENIRQRLNGITSIEELTELSFRAGAASSLSALYP
jgi:flagellar biosynthesis/type III secretory pathway protein FliH